MKTFLENLNKYWATPIIAIITGILGVYTSAINNKLEVQSANLAVIENQLKQKEYTNEIRLQAYSEVKDAIEKKDKKLQEAALLIVNVLLEAEDSLFKEKLIDLMRYSSNLSDSVKKDIQRIDTFNMVQTQKLEHAFTIDVFYLDDILKEAYPRAKKVRDLLAENYPAYHVRLRMLPKSINARSGYHIQANQIRYEKGEEVIARQCLTTITSKDIFSNEQPKLHLVKQETPNYISVFVRNM